MCDLFGSNLRYRLSVVTDMYLLEIKLFQVLIIIMSLDFWYLFASFFYVYFILFCFVGLCILVSSFLLSSISIIISPFSLAFSFCWFLLFYIWFYSLLGTWWHHLYQWDFGKIFLLLCLCRLWFPTICQIIMICLLCAAFLLALVADLFTMSFDLDSDVDPNGGHHTTSVEGSVEQTLMVISDHVFHA